MISIELKYDLKSQLVLVFNNSNGSNKELNEKIFKDLQDKWLSELDKQFLNESFFRIIDKVNYHLHNYSNYGQEVISVIISQLLNFEIESYSDKYELKNQKKYLKLKDYRSLQFKEIKNQIQLLINNDNNNSTPITITTSTPETSSTSETSSTTLSPTSNTSSILDSLSNNSSNTSLNNLPTSNSSSNQINLTQTNAPSTDYFEIIFKDFNLDEIINRIKILYTNESNDEIKLELDSLFKLISKEKSFITSRFEIYDKMVKEQLKIDDEEILNKVLHYKCVEEIGRFIQKSKLYEFFQLRRLPYEIRSGIISALNKIQFRNEIRTYNIFKSTDSIINPITEFKINNYNQTIHVPSIGNCNINIYINKLFSNLNCKKDVIIADQEAQQIVEKQELSQQLVEKEQESIKQSFEQEESSKQLVEPEESSKQPVEQELQQSIEQVQEEELSKQLVEPEESSKQPVEQEIEKSSKKKRSPKLITLLESLNPYHFPLTSIIKTKINNQLKGGLNKVLEIIISSFILNNRVVLGGQRDRELNYIKDIVFKDQFSLKLRFLIRSTDQWVESKYGSSTDEVIKDDLKHLLNKLRVSIILNNCVQKKEFLICVKSLKFEKIEEKEEMYYSLVQSHKDRESIIDFRNYNDSIQVLFDGFFFKGDGFNLVIPELSLYSETITERFTKLLNEFKFITDTLPSIDLNKQQNSSKKSRKSKTSKHQTLNDNSNLIEIKQELNTIESEKDQQDINNSIQKEQLQPSLENNQTNGHKSNEEKKFERKEKYILKKQQLEEQEIESSLSSNPKEESEEELNKSIGIWLTTPTSTLGKILKSIIESVIKTRKIKPSMALMTSTENELKTIKDIILRPEFTSITQKLLLTASDWVYKHSTTHLPSRHEKNLIKNLFAKLQVTILLNIQYQRECLFKSLKNLEGVTLSLEENSKAIQDFTGLQCERLKSILVNIIDFRDFNGSIESLFNGYTIKINNSVEINIPELNISQVSISSEFLSILNEFKKLAQFLPLSFKTDNQLTIFQSLLNQLNILNKDTADNSTILSELAEDFIKITIKSS